MAISFTPLLQKKRGWFKVTKKSRTTRPTIQVEEDQMDYEQTDLVEGAGQVVVAAGQQLFGGQTVMMGMTEVCWCWCCKWMWV